MPSTEHLSSKERQRCREIIKDLMSQTVHSKGWYSKGYELENSAYRDKLHDILKTSLEEQEWFPKKRKKMGAYWTSVGFT